MTIITDNIKFSKSVKEHFEYENLHTIAYNIVEKFGENGVPADNEEFAVEYGYGDAMVTLRYWNGYVIFVNTIGCS